MKAKKWLLIFSFLAFSLFVSVIFLVYTIDPYFHFHAPDTDKYYYTLDLDSERYLNNGILRHFDYNAIITGTSMCENFRCSELDELFGVSSVKVAFSGSSMKELSDNISFALRKNPNLKVILCSLDMNSMLSSKNDMNYSNELYPLYLYDDNPFNDIKYFFDKNSFLTRIVPMLYQRYEENRTPGITSFDDYAFWQDGYSFGISNFQDIRFSEPAVKAAHLSEEDRASVLENIRHNITALPEQYPDTEFYYFIPPYSILWWKDKYEDGTILKYLEAEKIYIEEMLAHDNIKLFSFNSRIDLITDLNYYRDRIHYGAWVNSAILRWIHDGKYRLTPGNCQSYHDVETLFFMTFDYRSFADRPEHPNDDLAGALLK